VRGRRPLLRWYERRILLPAIAVLTLVLALAVLNLRHQQALGARMAAGVQGAAVAREETHAARPDAGPITSAGWEPLRCGMPTGPRREGPLHATDPASRVGLAVDTTGHLALYGGADPRTGKPTGDGYEILRECSPGLAFANYASVLVGDREPEPAGASTLEEPTRRDADGSLLTRFTFPGGVAMDQRVRLEGKDLVVSYRLENRSGEDRTVSLRSLLTPPAQTGASREGRFVVPALENDPRANVLGLQVRSETTLLGAKVGPFEVPRGGVPSDSGGRWGPNGGASPDRLTFAATLRLQAAPFLYEARTGEPLPDASSFAAYWLEEELGPGESFATSERYVTAGPRKGR
jgi:hypothetical protein